MIKAYFGYRNIDQILKLLKKKLINRTPLCRHPGLECRERALVGETVGVLHGSDRKALNLFPSTQPCISCTNHIDGNNNNDNNHDKNNNNKNKNNNKNERKL